MNEHLAETLNKLKTPPNSLEAEQGVIGGLLIGADIDLVANIITPEDFYYPQNRSIYHAIELMTGKGLKIDLLTVSDFLDSRKESELVGGIAYLAELAKNTPSALNCPSYAQSVKDKSILRSLIIAGQGIAQLAYSSEPVEEKIAQAQNIALSIAEQKKENDVHEIGSIVPDILQDIEDRSHNKKRDGLATGYPFLDNILKGLRGGHSHILAARPGIGKTTLAINIAEHVAKENAVLIFSLEMPRKELVKRMISSLGRLSTDAIDDGEMEGKWDNLAAGVVKLKQLNISICDRSGLTISRIRTIARFHKKAKDTKLIVIDYIGLIRTVTSKNSNRNIELGEVSRQIKEMAKELNIPIITLAQLNRGIETRGDKTPTLADLRDSGEIEQDADTVTFLYRPSTELNGLTEVSVAKNRHGKTDKLSMVLNGQYSRFEQVSGHHENSQPGKNSWTDGYDK